MNIVLKRNGEEKAVVPFFAPLTLLGDVDEIARRFWERWTPFTMDESITPQTDLYEEKGHLVLKTDLPGIEAKDIDVTLEGDRLTIKAERKQEVKEEKTHHALERYYGQYYRSITLPYPVKEGSIKTTFDKGVLELRMPRAEEIKARKIEVKADVPRVETPKTNRKTGTKKT